MGQHVFDNTLNHSNPCQQQWVDTDGDLQIALSHLEKAEILAIDTEFTRERTFLPIPALIQISDGNTSWLIDAIKLDLGPLADQLIDSEQKKLFHSASQDMEIFDIITKGRPLKKVVDTQLAAQFLGINQGSIGLSNLVEQLLGIQLEKSQTVSDWSIRPLSDKQLQYAREDVEHLHEVWGILESKLQEEDKFEDFIEESHFQSQLKDPIESFCEKQLKFTDSPRYKALYRKILEWRESQALKSNIPRGWILKEGQIRKIASNDDPQSWLNPQILSPKQHQRYAPIFKSLHKEFSELSSKRQSISLEERQWFDTLSGKIRSKIQSVAQKKDVPPEMICNQRTLKHKTQLMIKNRSYDPFGRWRGRWLDSSLEPMVKNFFESKNLAVDKGPISVS